MGSRSGRKASAGGSARRISCPIANARMAGPFTRSCTAPLEDLGTVNLNESNADYAAIHRSILAGLLGHVVPGWSATVTRGRATGNPGVSRSVLFERGDTGAGTNRAREAGSLGRGCLGEDPTTRMAHGRGDRETSQRLPVRSPG